jgi:quinol monooxygenase YgiN
MVILRQQMRSKPERTDDVWAAPAAIIPGARATPGVVSLDIARDLLDPIRSSRLRCTRTPRQSSWDSSQ